MTDFSGSPGSPRLSIEHELIQLWVRHSDSVLSSDKITITNRGEGILIGKIIPQYPWIGIRPDEFKLLEGQSSDHQIILKNIPPYPASRRKVMIPNLFVIQSNAGSLAVNAELILPISDNRKTNRYPYFIMGGFILFIIFVSISLWLANQLRTRYAQMVATFNVAMLHTQAVQTIEAQKTFTPTSSPLPGNAVKSTLTPTLAENNTSLAPTMTYTPFVIDQNHNPETFINDYFLAISEGNTNQSWQMLSVNFQKKCCGQEGKDPYQVYLNEWKNVEKVLVVSAFLLDYRANPAPIRVNIQIINQDGITVDQSRVYWIIFDEILNSFLIDNID